MCIRDRGRMSEVAESGPLFATAAVGTSNWHTSSGPATLNADTRATIYSDNEDLVAAGNYARNYSHYVYDFKTSEATNDHWVDAAQNDAKPLYLRQPTFLFSEIRQSSPYPCDDNNIITVSLRSSIPLITQYGCPQNLTISGLKGFVNNNSLASINEGGNGLLTSVFHPNGTWDNTAGTLVVSVDTTMVAGELYVLAFRLHLSLIHI